MSSEPIVVTGLGCICAAGHSLDQVMPDLYAGKRRAGTPARFSTDLEKTYVAFEVDSELNDLNGEPFEPHVSRTSRLARIATDEALRMAGVEPDKLRRVHAGVCLGTTVGCTLNNEPFYRAFRSNKNPDLAPITAYLENNPALYLAHAYDLNGPAVTLANACSSGTDAIGLGKLWLETGVCDLVIAGGADELSRIAFLGFISLMITSPGPCRPFDLNRQGLNLGEGAGVVILETSRAAKRRGARPLAEVAGYGCSADAYHLTAPHPKGAGLRRAIDWALDEGELTAAEINFVNAHGTATPDNDRVEGKVMGDMFTDSVPVVSTKAYTGHTLGAAGGIEAALTIRALVDQELPATAGFAEADQACAIVPTTEHMSIKAKTAMSNSLAFGGNNSVLIFRGIE